jgi:valyl-tRNA synthetase
MPLLSTVMAETGATLTEQLDELGAQLDWVREYL